MSFTRRSLIKKSSYSAAAVTVLGTGVGLAQGQTSTPQTQCNDCPDVEASGHGERTESAERHYTKWYKKNGQGSKWVYGSPQNIGVAGDTRFAPAIAIPGGWPQTDFVDPCLYTRQGIPTVVDGNATPWVISPGQNNPPQGAMFSDEALPLGPDWIAAPSQTQTFNLERTVTWTDKQKYTGACQTPGH